MFYALLRVRGSGICKTRNLAKVPSVVSLATIYAENL